MCSHPARVRPEPRVVLSSRPPDQVPKEMLSSTPFPLSLWTSKESVLEGLGESQTLGGGTLPVFLRPSHLWAWSGDLSGLWTSADLSRSSTRVQTVGSGPELLLLSAGPRVMRDAWYQPELDVLSRTTAALRSTRDVRPGDSAAEIRRSALSQSNPFRFVSLRSVSSTRTQAPGQQGPCLHFHAGCPKPNPVPHAH